MDQDRVELQIAAIVGAVFGIVTGYAVEKPLLAILIWAFIGAVVHCDEPAKIAQFAS